MDYFGQANFAVRMDWGPTGAQVCAADASLVIDVLSFSTTVTVAVERGMAVFPCPWRDPRAAEFARAHDAVLAVGRRESMRSDGPPLPSLSPAGLLAAEPVPRLVLPSPNGSTIASLLRDHAPHVAVGCLRNASAAGAWAVRHVEAGRSVALIAAGERWSQDDSLRPALEDHLGAGAIAHHLRSAGYDGVLSPEARAAAELFVATLPGLSRTLRECVGGQELTARGFAADVVVASSVDATGVVPVLVDGAFQRV